jgi:hypothetical protein
MMVVLQLQLRVKVLLWRGGHDYMAVLAAAAAAAATLTCGTTKLPISDAILN